MGEKKPIISYLDIDAINIYRKLFHRHVRDSVYKVPVIKYVIRSYETSQL